MDLTGRELLELVEQSCGLHAIREWLEEREAELTSTDGAPPGRLGESYCYAQFDVRGQDKPLLLRRSLGGIPRTDAEDGSGYTLGSIEFIVNAPEIEYVDGRPVGGARLTRAWLWLSESEREIELLGPSPEYFVSGDGALFTLCDVFVAAP
jgi:hypothetical protein